MRRHSRKNVFDFVHGERITMWNARVDRNDSADAGSPSFALRFDHCNLKLWYDDRQGIGSLFPSSSFITTCSLFSTIQMFRHAKHFCVLNQTNACGPGADCYIEFSGSSDAQLPYATKPNLTATCVTASTAYIAWHRNEEKTEQESIHGADIRSQLQCFGSDEPGVDGASDRKSVV